MADDMNKKALADNIVSRAASAYRAAVPNPLVAAALAGGLAWGGTKLLYRPIMSTVRSFARTPGIRNLVGMSRQEADQTMDDMEYNYRLGTWLPVAAGAVAALGPVAMNFNKNKAGYGLTSWFPKSGSFGKYADLYAVDNYIPSTDFSAAINSRDALNLFSNDPHLQTPDNAYARNMGTAIVAAAAPAPGQPVTLGGIFDSAVNKIENKLTFDGLSNVALRSVIANTAAKLFTASLGTMVNLDPLTKDRIVDAGTWAGAVSAILQ